MWVTVATALVGLLAFGGLPVAPAQAAPTDLGLSVVNGGVTTLSSYTDVVTFESRISLPAGTSLQAGAVTKLTLDKSLKRSNNGTLPTGATAQTWNERANTLTVTWGPLSSGNVYAANVNATPSGIADQTSTFHATATLNGVLAGGGAVDQTTVSEPISPNSSFPATFVPATPNSWTLDRDGLSITVQPGAALLTNATLIQRVPGATFQDMQLSTSWGVQSGSDQLLPRSWVSGGPMMNAGSFNNYATLQDDAAVRAYSYGVVGGSTTTGNFRAYVTVPSDAAPGRYSVPVQFYDAVDATTRNLVYDTTVTVIVPEPNATAVTYTATRGASKVYPGGVFEWGQTVGFSAPPAPITDLTVTLPIPARTTPVGVAARFGTDIQSFTAKSYEYTTDSTVNDASSWQPLPLADDLITLGNPESITGIRYVMNDLKVASAAGMWGGVVTLRADEDLTPGQVLRFDTASVAYNDPVAGGTTVTPTASFGKNVTVVADTGAVPIAAAQDAPVGNGNLSFDQTYPNGASFSTRFFLGSDGLTPLQQPYQFVVVPRGVDVSSRASQACSPYLWAYQQGGCNLGMSPVSPTPVIDSGFAVLSDGSKLFYSRMTQGQLLIGGATLMQQLHSQMTLTPKTALAGPQKVLVGMGSMTQNDFAVSATHSTRDSYPKTSLSNSASYGSYSSLASEIQGKLAGLGIETDTAFMGERVFNVSPATSVGSVTTIKGSEDATGIMQGAGTATARPGGVVSYSVDVSNTGSLEYQNFQFIDQLPSVGDGYTLNAGVARGSAFDVNLSGNVKVLLNGVPSASARVEYTTSAAPARFDANGADIAGDAWLPYTGSATGAKALRVTLASGTVFGPADKITLSFDATVPASAPRDGSTAKNTIAYRFQTGPSSWVAAETPSVPVKSSAPAGDTELSGQAFIDLNGDGIQQAGEPGLNGSGVSLQLYKMVSGNPVVVGSPVTPNTDAGVYGAFSMIGLDPNQTYKIKPVSSNPNVTVVPSALDADGFLKYAQVTDAAVNGSENTSQYVGSSSFLIGDQVGAKKWIKDLRLPLTAKTTVSGSLQLTDTSNTPMTAGVGSNAADYVKNYTVKLMQGTTEKASTTTDVSGGFAFTSVEGLTPGDYRLVFVSPSGRKLVGSPLNNGTVFTGAATAGADGTYKLAGLQPGTGASGVNVYYTDTDAPVATVPTLSGGVVIAGSRFNPQAATLSGTDVGTRVTKYAWQVLAGDNSVVASGNVAADATGDANLTLPTTMAEGGYTLSVVATDVVGNVSPAATAGFAVDKTAPVIASTESSVTYVKTSPAAPTTTQGWIDLYGVTATDTGAGMPATGGITVDASAVDPTTAGSYTVTFTATDAAGNTTASFDVTYLVAYVGDPTITLGTNTAFFEMGTTPPATDAAWKALFGGVTTGTSGGATVTGVAVDTSAVDVTTRASYPVVFTVTDSLGYTASTTGTLTVRDTIAPAITTTTDTLTYQDGDTQIDNDQDWITAYGATASDTGSGVASLTVEAGSVDYTTAGTYVVTFTATDNAGNTSTKTVNYTIAFAGAPSITLGNTPVVYEMGGTKPKTEQDWIDLFDATAAAAKGATIKSFAVDHSAVDFTMLNSTGYDVVFTATDSYDNSFTYTGKLIVADTKAPTVTVGKAKAKHAQRAPETPFTTADWLTMFDVIATDTQGGSGIDPDGWTVTEGVNYTLAGDYEIVFTATDIAGNVSKKATATFTVQAPPTSDTVTMNTAQDKKVGIDPLGRSTTTGSFKALAESDLSEPSAGGTAKLDRSGVVYTPTKGYFGEDTLTVTVTDDLGQTAKVMYIFTVVKKPDTVAKNLPEYSVPVDGRVVIPVADVLNAVDVTGLTIDELVTPKGFHGRVKLDKDQATFTTDGSNWHGDEKFTVTLRDALGQTVDVPLTLHVVPPTLTIDQAQGYAGKTEVTLTANGVIPGKEYAFELHSDPMLLGTAIADANGTAILTTTIPAKAAAGAHHVRLFNADAKERGSVAFEVLSPDGPTAATTTGGPETGATGWLSLTGGNGFGIAAIVAFGLLLLGALLFIALRFRGRSREEKETMIVGN
ncbi:hypothetical protein G7068_08630 [Leucobacter viscericola]|uniref:HYR domain-containing protein n=1 Tax=Leucobacter viscericola TaxID=2714935 RepID=A0A6G7XFL0_9MICO|nr:Ig-like domain-containing protein [Leucobacter viscericola]QIK63256.1 hypothetical protein G7068_08630 [Leucobacter viscericola]